MGETNRMVAGAIGFVRLAQLVDDQEATDLGFYLFNKALTGPSSFVFCK